LCDGLRAIDIDIDEPMRAVEVQMTVESHLGVSTVVRTRGNSSRLLIVYRAAEGGEPRKVTLSSDHGKIEVLGYGQQFVAYGTHYSGAELEWLNGSPLTVPRDRLPAVTEAQVAACLAACAAILGPSATISGRAEPGESSGNLAGASDDVAAAVAVLRNDGPADWDSWNRVGMAMFSATDGDDAGLDLFLGYSERHESFDADACRERWDHWSTSSPPTSIGAGTLYHMAAEAVPGWVRPSAAPTHGAELTALPPEIIDPPRRRRLTHPADCTLTTGREYRIKGLLAIGDVAALIGQPGCGKSILAPYLAYAVAQGRPAFGMRTKPGRTLYLAAEDFSGMRNRVHALRRTHGDAPDFAMMDVGNLREPAQIAELRATVADWRPVLIVIDTLGAAFAGMDENSAQDMGDVVKLARELAATGCAVLLVHHVAKQGDGSPRGHSVLNGTLDMSVRLEPKNAAGVIHGSLLKNRNGTTEKRIAFRFAVDTLGRDSDGDDITAPRAVEVDRDVTPVAKLTGCETATLGVLRTMAGQAAGQRVSEAAWRDRCDDERTSTAAEPDSRRRAFQRAFAALKAAGLVLAGDDMVWPTADVGSDSHCPGQLDLESNSDDLATLGMC
jgi:hypothetical protein